MSFDDELRDRLRSEPDHLAPRTDAAELLDTIRPELRRARRLRRGTQLGVVALLFVTGLAIARIGTNGSDGETLVVPAVDGDPIAPPRTHDRSDPEPEPATRRPSTTAAPDGSDDPTDRTAADDVADTTAPLRATPVDDEPPTSSTGVSTGSDDPTTASEVDAPPAPIREAGDPLVPDHDATTTTVADTAVDDPPTTVATTLAPTASTTTFDSACGIVVADLSGTEVTILEIDPEPGYRARVEDPDHGSVTVHFEGGGEDCELKIG